jgi:hypothetical protein
MARDPYEQRVPGSRVPPELALSSYLPNVAVPPSPPRATPPIAAGAVAPALEAAFDRLEELIDQENDALIARGRPDFADINRRKSQSLLELTRLGRAIPQGPSAAFHERVMRLRDKLLANQRTLSLHLSAVREIAAIMVGALAEAESDGTYGKLGRRGGPAR